MGLFETGDGEEGDPDKGPTGPARGENRGQRK